MTRLILALVAAGAVLGGPALAQSAKTIERSVATGKQIRVLAVPNLKKDCSLGPQPELKVTAAPKNGTLTQRAGRTKTPATYRCPNAETTIQALVYESKAGFTGTDEATVEVKGTDGATVTRTIRIKVGGEAKGESKGDSKGDAKSDAKSDATDL
ncbi:4-aminobutyrate aminotransferase [Methylobacterium sp. JK268]